MTFIESLTKAASAADDAALAAPSPLQTIHLQTLAQALRELVALGNAPLTVRKNSGADVGTRPRVNFIEGVGILLTVVDDAIGNEIDLTVTGTGVPAGHHVTHEDGGTDEILVTGLSGLLADPQKVTVRKNSGADVGTRKRINLIEGANVTLTVADDGVGNEVDVTIAAAGATVAVSSANLDFTDGDTLKRFTIVDGTVIAGSKIVGMVRRPNSTDDTDRGYLYEANVVRVAAGQFDLLVAITDGDGNDVTMNPPSETAIFYYLVG